MTNTQSEWRDEEEELKLVPAADEIDEEEVTAMVQQAKRDFHNQNSQDAIGPLEEIRLCNGEHELEMAVRATQDQEFISFVTDFVSGPVPRKTGDEIIITNDEIREKFGDDMYYWGPREQK